MVKIGITGHRFLDIDAALIAGIDAALAALAAAYTQPWALISSLAEGADCLVLQRAVRLRPDLRLCAVLPLPAAAFRRDFSTPAALDEFEHWLARADEVAVMPARVPPELAYRLAGTYLVRRAGALLAVWDGLPPLGPGGTGEVVVQARHKRLPLAWVLAGNRNPASDSAVPPLPETAGLHGRVQFENFPPGSRP